MSRLLFSFVGLAQYSRTTYVFRDLQGFSMETRWVPQALAAALAKGSSAGPLDKIVLIGTETSGWHQLANALDEDGAGEAGAAGRPRAEAPQPVTNEELRDLEHRFTRMLGIPVVAEIAPYGLIPEEQLHFFSLLGRHVMEQDVVHFDVTYGLRHIPMLALTGALALQKLKHAHISGIWYGPWHLRSGEASVGKAASEEETSVIRLDGLLSIAEWLSAIAIFDATADISAFSKPLDREGERQAANRLRDAVFQERIQGARSAQDAANLALAELETVEQSPGLQMVKPQIHKRLAWASSKSDIDLGFAQAMNFIASRNEVRAFTLAYQTALAKLSQCCHPAARDEDLTEKIASACREARRRGSGEAREYAIAYLDLKALRNTIVHVDERIRMASGRQKMAQEEALASPQRLADRFRLLTGILKKPVPKDLSALLRL